MLMGCKMELRDNQAMPDNPKTELIARLNKAFAGSGLNKSQLAKACDVSDQAVQGWFRVGTISREKAQLAAEAMNVGADWLYFGSGKEKANSGGLSPVGKLGGEMFEKLGKEDQRLVRDLMNRLLGDSK